MEYLSKFQLNGTVNELGTAILRKLHKLEKKCSRPATRSYRPAKKKPKTWCLVLGNHRPIVPTARKIRKTTYLHLL